jgi:fumarate reductase subunit C
VGCSIKTNCNGFGGVEEMNKYRSYREGSAVFAIIFGIIIVGISYACSYAPEIIAGFKSCLRAIRF